MTQRKHKIKKEYYILIKIYILWNAKVTELYHPRPLEGDQD